GRITRQKVILHLVRSIPHLEKGAQILLCASSPDTPELGEQMRDMLDKSRQQSSNPIIWVQDSVPRQDIVPLYSQAAAFVCPSIYEPFGIVNLEAMSCGTPVVASQVGGIPEILDHGRDGYLVPLEPVSQSDAEPKNPEDFSQALAREINKILQDPEQARQMGQAAREKVLARYSWQAIARQTLELYQELQAGR
ncbi:MAG: glycosyltransferase, partial [Desulfohalobiaceae bacterium]